MFDYSIFLFIFHFSNSIFFVFFPLDIKCFTTEMDDGGRCLLDVINDPQLLQSFLENNSNNNNNNVADKWSSWLSCTVM